MGCEHWEKVRMKGLDRPELKYWVKDVSDRVTSIHRLNKEIKRVLKSKMENFEDGDRAIIYCLQRKWAEELATFLNKEFGEEICGTYHAKMDRAQRGEVFERWKDGDLKFIAATSALGAGINYDKVRLVIHQGYGKNMLDFCQETGRGGRDGEKAEAVTLFWCGIVDQSDWVKDEEREDVLAWINGKECRRLMMGRCIEGVGTNCMSVARGELCDICDDAMARAKTGGGEWTIAGWSEIRRGVQLEMNEAREVSDIKQMISE